MKFFIHSLIGSTGGGITCKLFELIKEHFEVVKICSLTVLPFVNGESSLQYYNALLTLHWITRYCDMVIILNNDNMLKHTQTANKIKNSCSFYDMNQYIAKCFLQLLLPLEQSSEKESTVSRRPSLMNRPFSDTALIMNHNQFYSSNVNLNKENKLTIRTRFSRYSISQDLYDSPKVLSKEKQSFFDTMMHSSSKFHILASVDCNNYHDPKRTLSSLINKIKKSSKAVMKINNAVVISNNKNNVFDEITENMLVTCLQKTLKPIKNSQFICFKVIQNRGGKIHNDGVMTILYQTDQIKKSFELILNKATVMYEMKAFLHWYTKCGFKKTKFIEAMQSLKDTVGCL